MSSGTLAVSGRLQGRVAVVTGGAGGLGEACVRDLIAQGARPVITDLASTTMDAAAGELGVPAFPMDIRSSDSVEDACEAIERSAGPVDIVVNCAGVNQARGRADELDMQEWDRVSDVTLRGAWLVLRTFGSRMAKRRRGSMVAIASICGMRSVPLHVYAPAKAAVISVVANLATEWGRFGVRVNAVSPSFTLTPRVRRAVEKGERDVRRIVETTALGRMLEPHEVAKAVTFLVSDDASGITGINLPVDAGWTAASSWTAYSDVPRP
jgi:NAD(P)-dependent dehydrogenase (short-subunit alcohol dehydrogenase family)